MSRTSSPTMRNPSCGLTAALGEVFGSRSRQVAFAVLAAGVALLYTLLLPFDFTQRLEFANWEFLTAYQGIWSAALGVGMALVLVIQGYAMRRITRAKAATGTVGGLAFVASLLPSFLCCTPFIPTLLAFVGLSGVSLYSTTGTVQHVFAVYQTEFLAGSTCLLLLTAWWGLHKVASARCAADGGCVPAGAASAGCCPTAQPAGTARPAERVASAQLSTPEAVPRAEVESFEVSAGDARRSDTRFGARS